MVGQRWDEGLFQRPGLGAGHQKLGAGLLGYQPLHGREFIVGGQNGGFACN